MLFDLFTASLMKRSVPFPPVTKSMIPHTTTSVRKEEMIDTAITFFFVFLLSFLKLFTGAAGEEGTTAEELETVLPAGLACRGRTAATRGGRWGENWAGRSSCSRYIGALTDLLSGLLLSSPLPFSPSSLPRSFSSSPSSRFPFLILLEDSSMTFL